MWTAISAADAAVLEALMSLRVGWLNHTAGAASPWLAPRYVFIVSCAIGALVRNWRLPAAVGIASLAATGMKHLVNRPRPDLDVQLIYEYSPAMPSSHAAAAVAVAMLVTAWGSAPARRRGHAAARGIVSDVHNPVSRLRPWHRRALVGSLWLVAVLSMAMRLYLGVHWLSDVVVGAALGAAVGWACSLDYRGRNDHRNG